MVDDLMRELNEAFFRWRFRVGMSGGIGLIVCVVVLFRRLPLEYLASGGQVSFGIVPAALDAFMATTMTIAAFSAAFLVHDTISIAAGFIRALLIAARYPVLSPTVLTSVPGAGAYREAAVLVPAPPQPPKLPWPYQGVRVRFSRFAGKMASRPLARRAGFVLASILLVAFSFPLAALCLLSLVIVVGFVTGLHVFERIGRFADE